jgi:hypothetical protein
MTIVVKKPFVAVIFLKNAFFMTVFELLSIILALLALLVSAFTAYVTFLAKFKGEVFVKPRIILTRINTQPVIVTGCEMSNSSSKSGAIDDMILLLKYRQTNNRSVNRYTFYPILVREEFSIFKTYQPEIDFDPFQSISISANTRLVKYIVFSPSTDSFSPSIGQGELELWFRYFGDRKWRISQNNKVTLEIDDKSLGIWSNPQGKSVMIETVENYKHRDDLLGRM